MTDHYAVVGNPIGHSKSPIIHRLFAEQSGQDMEYRAELGDLCDFEEQVADWFKSDLRGLNVTLPFKERALALATKKTSRAVIAGASNTLRFNSKTEEIEADNTDGVGLMRDLQDRLGIELKRKRILILGAGGATRGILGPILETHPALVVLTNRTEARALSLVQSMQIALGSSPLVYSAPSELVQHHTNFDLIINATSASLKGEVPPLPPGVWAEQTVAYDLAYVPSGETAFLAYARQQGATQCADGLGMLVEQAAEAFYWWRGVLPDTVQVLKKLRSTLAKQ
jgi:shikimate dehydrogenase